MMGPLAVAGKSGESEHEEVVPTPVRSIAPADASTLFEGAGCMRQRSMKRLPRWSSVLRDLTP